MAGHPRPVGRPRVRGHGPADRRRPRRAAVPRLPRPLPRPRGLRGGAGGRRGPGVAGARLQPPGGEPARLRPRRSSPPRRAPARRPRRPAGAARHRARTRPGPCWPSPTSGPSGWSTPTSAGCWPAGRAGRCGGPRPRPWPTPLGPGGGERSWAWNQAMMELGATVCRRRRPDCAACPVRAAVRVGGRRPGRPRPADGSAGVSTGQPRFEGSDRQGRGRLVAALCAGPVAAAALAAVMGWPDDPARADRVAVGMVADGLAARRRRSACRSDDAVRSRAVSRRTRSDATGGPVSAGSPPWDACDRSPLG